MDSCVDTDITQIAGYGALIPEYLKTRWKLHVPVYAQEYLDGSPLSAGTEGVVFLVPGVAFDPRGVRLGRGAGCYDRALARHPTALRVGLAYEMQVVPSLPEATWDVPMDAVVTEARVLVRKETSP